MPIKGKGKRVRQKQYAQYLSTPYWRMVAAAVIARDKRCTKCGDTKRLEVHHLTYAHRGQEHAHLGDLVTWCRKCHRKHHQNVRKIQKSKRTS